MSDNRVGKVLAALHLLEVGAHLARRPRIVTRQRGDVVPVAIMRIDGDQSIVRSAAAESASPRVEDAQHLRSSWGVLTGLDIATGRPPLHLGVALCSRVIAIVLDEVVPS